ncbi:MAG TPA: GNAT family N-acetyltransferase/peptidase C39 family protein [Xanthobacteraceae bacterium]|nr:GNAT family N-acetyltransferase/peptidase C39 family protein [Xanthobacteraceae bacterium]
MARLSQSTHAQGLSRPRASLSSAAIGIRRAEAGDLDGLLALERSAFTSDHISRRGFVGFLRSPSATLIVATCNGALAGYALALYRARSSIARIYSIAVTREFARQGIGGRLLAAIEEAAIARDRIFLRLEVHENNTIAIKRYQKSGYSAFGRYSNYYEDGGNALRFEKRLMPVLMDKAPPYFHQTTEFTCGPACAMMALAWADPDVQLNPALEFRLWREATTIYLSSGHGGCEPYGLAVTLKRHGLAPEIHVSHPGPYFLDTVRSDDKRRVMQLTQQEFHREADELGIVTRLTALSESALMSAFDSGAAAIILVSGYHMVRKSVPHWVFAFGNSGRHILVHDPATSRNEKGQPVEAETYAVPWTAFEPMTRFGRNHLQAAVLIRRGSAQ